jgi:hypothetical protein
MHHVGFSFLFASGWIPRFFFKKEGFRESSVNLSRVISHDIVPISEQTSKIPYTH